MPSVQPSLLAQPSNMPNYSPIYEYPYINDAAGETGITII